MHVRPPIDLIIPAFNEALSIGKVIRAIPRDAIRHIIVCDNESTDATALEAEKAGATVVYAPGRGYGSACLAGMEHIRKIATHDPPLAVVFMDGDFSDFPEEIPLLTNAIAKGTDLVIGSRVSGQSEAGSLTVPQRFGNWLATRLISIFWGFSYTDLGPFRAIRWDKLEMLDMQDRTYGWTVEMQIKALKHNLVCAEVPVSYRKRIGVSKISGTISGTIKAGYKILRTIFKLL